MRLRPHVAAGCVWSMVLLSAHCGYIGIELLAIDGGMRDASPAEPQDAASADSSQLDASPEASVDASDASWADADASRDSGPPRCDFSGTWVIKFEVDTSWTAGVVAAGSGTANVWMKYRSTASGEMVPGTLVTCGITMPDFTLQALLGGDTCGIAFLRSPLFDAVPSRLVATDTSIIVGGTGFHGAPVTMGQTAIMMGATMTNPLTDAWPAVAALADSDLDMDGQDGVTFEHYNDATRVYPRIDLFGTARAERAYYAARVIVSASGTVVDCAEMMGQATLPRFDTHILGCARVGGGSCTTTQRDTLDGARPIHRADAASYRARNVGADVSCTVARTMLP